MIKKRLLWSPYLLVLILFWGIIYIICNPLDAKIAPITALLNGPTYGIVGNITKGTVISQTFVAQQNDLEEIIISPTTNTSANNCFINIKIQKDTGESLCDYQVDAATLLSNSNYSITFPIQRNSQGVAYTLTISGIDGTEDNAPTLFMSKQPINNAEYAVVNGVDQEYGLLLQTKYDVNNLKKIYLLFWFFLVILSFLYVLFMGDCNEKTFLLFSLILGCILIFLNPFYHVYDEITHFFRSFSISQFNLLDTIKDGKIGANVADNFYEIVDSIKLSLPSFLSNPKHWLQHFNKEKAFYVHPYMSAVPPINHIFAAIGIFIARLFRLNSLFIILAGRISTYIYYTSVCYFAIKNAKHYKTLFFVTATLPSAQWLAASYSADPILLANSLLFVSICFKYTFQDEYNSISMKDIILIIYCGICITSVKYYVYTPILLLFFLIPRNCFSKKKYVITLSIAVAVLFGMGIWQIDLLHRFPFKEDRNGHVDVIEQVVFMKYNLLWTIKNFTNYFINSIFGHMTNLFYYSVLPNVSSFFSIGIVASAIVAPDKYCFRSEKRKRNILLLFLFIVTTVYFLTIAALYIGFTPVGVYDVQGVQTRYLLPIIILIMFCLSMIDWECNTKTFSKHLAFMSGLAQILCLVGVLNKAFLE